MTATSITLHNRKSTPIPIVVSTLLLGMTSPVVSFLLWQCVVLYQLHETNDTLQIIISILFAITWPMAWIFAMFLGALNPLFGKTTINITNEYIEVEKRLFSVRWKYFRCANNDSATLSILQQTHQSPTHSSANQMGKGSATCTYYRLMLRHGTNHCLLHESCDESEETALLHRIRQAMNPAGAQEE